MKKRFFDRDSWKNKSFRDMKGWAQLLDIYMYFDVADFAGIAELDLHLASYNIKMLGFMPDDMNEIAKELEPRWARIGECLFIKKNFLDETQAGTLLPTNPPHVCVFKDMHERWKQGLEDVVRIVLHYNPSTRFQSLADAEREINEAERRIEETGNRDRLNGFKGRRKTLDDARRYLSVLAVGDHTLPIMIEAESHKENEDPKRPSMHPDQSKPMQAGVTQAKHEEAIRQGYYMLKNGQYSKPLL